MDELLKLDFSNNNIDKTLPVLSISNVLDSLEKPFDKEGVAEKTFNKHFNNPESQYYQKSVNEIISMWEAKGAESCHYGSLLDDYIGIKLTGSDNDLSLYKLNNGYDYDNRLHKLCDSFDHFYEVLSKSGDTVFVAREKTVYLKVISNNPLLPHVRSGISNTVTYYIKGRFDALFYNKRTNKWIVIDWKSSGSIDKVPNRWTEKFYGPMMKYPALNYYRYTNQLHFYKKALLENYLPAGTNADDVIVMIVNLPGKLIEESNNDYMTHLEAIKYDPILLDNIFKFAICKSLLSAPKQETNTEDIIIEKSDNIENLF